MSSPNSSKEEYEAEVQTQLSLSQKQETIYHAGAIAQTLQMNEARLDDVDLPEFKPKYREELMKIYEILMTARSYMERDAALKELVKMPGALKEFLRKTLPASNIYPPLPNSYFPMIWIDTPQIQNVYEFKSELLNIHSLIRSANTKEEREDVLKRVIAKPRLVKEFLKRNVPRFSHL